MVYNAIRICDNCGFKHIFTVEDKTTVKEHMRLKSEKCGNCGFRVGK